MDDRIEQRVELKAPVARVWQAVGDHRQFGAWFRVAIDAPFAVGHIARGNLREEGYEHLVWEVTIEAIEPERRLAFRWHPYAIDPEVDYSDEPTTLVEFLLAPEAGGTLLRVVESGFGAIPDERRDQAFAMNARGWTEQMRRIRAYVDRA